MDVEALKAKGIDAKVMWDQSAEYEERREAVVVDFHGFQFARYC